MSDQDYSEYDDVREIPVIKETVEKMRQETLKGWNQITDGATIEYLEVTHIQYMGYEQGDWNNDSYRFDLVETGIKREYKFTSRYGDNAFGNLTRVELAERLSVDNWELVSCSVMRDGKIQVATMGWQIDGTPAEKSIMIFKRRM